MKYPKPLFGELSDSQKPVITSKQAIDDLWELLDDNINSHSKIIIPKQNFIPIKTARELSNKRRQASPNHSGRTSRKY